MEKKLFICLKNGKNRVSSGDKTFYLKGLTPTEITAELNAVHGKSAPVFKTVYNWVNEFKRGRTSTKMNLVQDAP